MVSDIRPDHEAMVTGQVTMDWTMEPCFMDRGTSQ